MMNLLSLLKQHQSPLKFDADPCLHSLSQERKSLMKPELNDVLVKSGREA